MFTKTSAIERTMLIAAGLLLVYPTTWADVAGTALVAGTFVIQRLRRRARRPRSDRRLQRRLRSPSRAAPASRSRARAAPRGAARAARERARRAVAAPSRQPGSAAWSATIALSAGITGAFSTMPADRVHVLLQPLRLRGAPPREEPVDRGGVHVPGRGDAADAAGAQVLEEEPLAPDEHVEPVLREQRRASSGCSRSRRSCPSSRRPPAGRPSAGARRASARARPARPAGCGTGTPSVDRRRRARSPRRTRGTARRRSRPCSRRAAASGRPRSRAAPRAP